MIAVLTFNLTFLLFSSFAAYHDFCAGRDGWGIAWSVIALFVAFSISFGIEDTIERSKKDKEMEAEDGKQVQE